MGNSRTIILDLYKEYVPIERFMNDGASFKVINKSDFISYKEFIEYFSKIEVISKHNLIIGINFTYGWMPTIFDFRSECFEESIMILNNCKKGEIPGTDHLKTLRSLFNNSLVGTSKLLHFINPSVFAIWDSRVYHYLTGKTSYEYRINDFGAYLSYLGFCEYLTNRKEYDIIHDYIVNLIGYKMTKFRTAELIMYSKFTGKRD